MTLREEITDSYSKNSDIYSIWTSLIRLAEAIDEIKESQRIGKSCSAPDLSAIEEAYHKWFGFNVGTIDKTFDLFRAIEKTLRVNGKLP